MHTRALVLLAVTAASLLSEATSGQCPTWLEGPLGPLPVGVLAHPDGADPTVTSAVPWDHDGNPATPNWLVIAGTFATACGTAATNVAAWDGAQFRPLGAGISAPGATDAVTSLLVYESSLYATSQLGLFEFDGMDWMSLDGPQSLGFCRAVARYSNSIVVATQLGKLLFWLPNPGTWFEIGSVPGVGTINDLLWHDGDLYVCGSFTSVGGVPASGIARWNFQSWTALGVGLSESNGLLVAQDMCIDPVSGDLFVVGRFDNAGGTPATGVGRWDGNNWIPVPTNPSFASGIVRCVATTRPDRSLVVARMSATSADPIPKVWVSDGAAWQPTDSNFDSSIACVGIDDPSSETLGDERIVIGGLFKSLNGTIVNSLVIEADHPDWQVFRQPIAARAIASAGGWTFGGGDFNLLTPNGTIHRVARTDGTTTLPLTGPAGEGANAAVHAIYARTVPGAIEVFIGGDFTSVGGVAASRIAKFTLPTGATTGTWSAMGSGFNDTVLTIAEHNGDIYAGGTFTFSGLTLRSHIARWNGISWASVSSGFGNGLNDTVHALASFNGQLYATGEFTGTGIGGSFGRIARWTGSAWQQLTPNALAGLGRSLVVDGSTLVVGGTFASAGGLGGTGAIARWNGSAWSSIGGGFIGNVYALARAGGSLWAGGVFLFEGDPDATLARFQDGAWDLPGDLGQPNLIVRGLLAAEDEVQVVGSYMDIGAEPAIELATWSILSLSASCCVGDVDGNGAVDGADLATLLGLWGVVPAGTPADIDGNGVIDGADLAAMLGGWGGCP
jgi:trimeric autotransporter adhesin